MLNPNAGDAIDTLAISLSNPVACCGNPMGLDNIVVADPHAGTHPH